jgi:L-asparaginase II
VGPISVAVERGDLVESRHRVHAVRVADGEIAAWGDPGLATFLRSAAKPFQALPLADAFPELPSEELAIACASHEALPEQLEAVRSLLARADAAETDLECGREDEDRIRHNCSGKHAGMLLLCRVREWARAGYRLPDHPLQQELLGLVAEAAGVRAEAVRTATDGCGVVAFALPLERTAFMLARLARRELPGADAVMDAMMRHPLLVGGPAAVDTRLMRALPGAVAKRGAEGILAVVLPDRSGLVLKAEDGAQRPLLPAAARLLDLTDLAVEPIENSRGEVVGRVGVEP